MKFRVKGIIIGKPRKEQEFVIEADSESEVYVAAKSQGIQPYEIDALSPKLKRSSRTFPFIDFIIIAGVLSIFCAAIFGIFYLLTLDRSPPSASKHSKQIDESLGAIVEERDAKPVAPKTVPTPNTKPRLTEFLLKGADAEKRADYQKAVTIYETGLEHYPDAESLYLSIGLCQSELNDTEQEIATYKKGLRVIPDSALLTESLANTYLQNKQYGDSARAYSKAVDLKPNDAGTWFFYGVSLMRSGRDQEAEDAFLHSSAIDPEVANTWYNVALVSARQGEFPNAIMHYTRALRIDVSDKNAWKEYSHTLTKYGPHRAYCLAWVDGTGRSDLQELRERAASEVSKTAYSVFPQLRNQNDHMWVGMERALAKMQEVDPDVSYDPLVLLRCALAAAEKMKVRPSFPSVSTSEKGTLKIRNETGSDALVKIYDIDKKRVWRQPSVLNGGSNTVRNVPDGHYLILFALMENLNPRSGVIEKEAIASKFDKSIVFTTSRELEGNTIYEETTTYTISLHKVVGGNAKTSGIPLEEFMAY